MFPTMLDQYQIQLTRMLEAEQYGEAKRLLHFLLKCQGEDQRHYEEWGNLLSWLDMAFPDSNGGSSQSGAMMDSQEDDEDEDSIRQQVLTPVKQDDAYVEQILYIIQHHPVVDQQVLALERAVHLDHPDVDTTLVSWLTGSELHPALQFKALQCLRKREVTGRIQIQRLGETVDLEIEETPLSMDDFPDVVNLVAERVESVTEVLDSTLPHFAKELWKECLQCLYGTTIYNMMVRDEEDTVDCFAAALHQTLELSLYGRSDDDQLRDTYGITDALRFRYEQACRALRLVAQFHGEDSGGEP
ncbi:hypothetical protein [Paenibacillus spongiae]|uniref:HEAT repeat domain-containing protein n=1 Tax=Paenibacillus spongiae TaxID=2909671 RepID=A0ABY5S3J7_9BACL|nr:hypothetical protein [Paenibacillus spongiae]UVI28145.1 hypothetical protein L1F29_22160 [Paenibacillus spongiae]